MRLEVILNGNSKKRAPKVRVGVYRVLPRLTEDNMLMKRRKARTMLMAVPKRSSRPVLKQQFEAFTISSKESLEKGYDRYQKLLSQLDALGAGVSDEDANHKFLRSLPPGMGQSSHDIE
ncbi:hypothetical protein Tco_0291440 [Tanacetum coccineum]